MSKLENNIRSLLLHCEDIIKDDLEEQKWRLDRYIRSLDTMLKEFEDYETSDRKNLSNYIERIRELKVAINYTDQPVQSLKSKVRNQDNIGDGILKEIKQLSNAKYNSELRKELFDGDDSSGLRRRAAADSAENMEKYYGNIQEKLSDEMLTLTRNLKEQTLTASKIIKKDTSVVTKSAKIAHQNTGSLEKESKKLDEHNKRACKCWMWMMIAIVVVIFIAMAVFMKLIKKSKPTTV